jgi:cytochrome c-type biogenesis protein CcmH
MNKKIFLWSTLLSVVLFALSWQFVLAQDPTPEISDDQVNALAKQLYCPVCENIPLDVCPTTACAQWRELIREKMAAGWTDEQIKQYLALQYGDRVLSEPPRQGLNWLVYILPPLVFLGGVFVLGWVLRSMKKNTPLPAETPPTQVEDAYVKRLEEELKRKID